MHGSGFLRAKALKPPEAPVVTPVPARTASQSWFHKRSSRDVPRICLARGKQASFMRRTAFPVPNAPSLPLRRQIRGRNTARTAYKKPRLERSSRGNDGNDECLRRPKGLRSSSQWSPRPMRPLGALGSGPFGIPILGKESSAKDMRLTLDSRYEYSCKAPSGLTQLENSIVPDLFPPGGVALRLTWRCHACAPAPCRTEKSLGTILVSNCVRPLGLFIKSPRIPISSRMKPGSRIKAL